MRLGRQGAILEIIAENFITTQKELKDKLKGRGFNVTQATVSRDIKDLRLVKSLAQDGRYRYAQELGAADTDETERLDTILKTSVVSVDYAMNNIVVKTLSGMAQAAAYAIDSIGRPEIIGTIGGDDTVVIIVRDEKNAKSLALKLGQIMEKR